MTLERVELFNKKDLLSFILLSLFILSYSLLINFNDYKNLTRFDTYLIDATVLKQYVKTKDSKSYQVLKLKTDDGITFYTSAKKSFENVIGKELTLEIYTNHISFYEYLTSFYAYSHIQNIMDAKSIKKELNSYIASQHANNNITNIYQALFTATPLNKELQTSFSFLGVSHLLAISGFHLGVLSALLFFVLKPLYSFFQNRYFPYRNSKIDLFLVVASFLMMYLVFLNSPPSLLRAFVMLIIGFVLYDRGVKIVSMQTLLLTIILLIAFFPKLFFALGFWLSCVGVFSIFLFLIHFKHLSKTWQFILLPFWVYLLMLPYSLVIFGSFSIYHPLSIIWTTLFSVFYPFSIFLHLVGFGNLFDSLLINFLTLSTSNITLEFNYLYLFMHVLLSVVSIFKKFVLIILFTESIVIFLYSFYKIV
jgi:competence protein ComEC